MKVLLVEDDMKIATAVKRGLEAEGLTIEIAFDGEDGLWRATEAIYDLVILSTSACRSATVSWCAPNFAPAATGHRS